MATQFSVSTVFKGVDKMSGIFKKMSRNGTSAFKKITGALEKFNRKTAKLRKFAGGAAAFAGITGGAILAKQALTDTIQKGVEFEKTLVSASVKFVDGAKRGTEQFDKLKETVLEVGATTEFTASQAAQGLDFLAMAGFNSTQAIAALPGVVDLATAANVDLATATDQASDSLGAFNLMTQDSEQLTKNLARVNDVLAKTTTTANVDMTQLFETIKDAAPVVTSAGGSIEEFAALTGLMANAGIKGTKAGTTLKNMFLNIQAPTKAQKGLLKEMEIQIKDTNGQMLPMANILGQLNKGTAKMTDVQRNAAIATLFGKRAVAGATVLLNTGQAAIDKYTKSLESSTGATKQMAEEMRNTTEGRIKVMGSAIEALQLQIFEALEPALNSAVKIISKMASAMAKFAKENPAVVKTIGALAAILATLTVAIVAGTAAIWLFNAAMAANPIVWVIAGVLALLGALALLVVYWEEVFVFMVKNAEYVTLALGLIMGPIGWIIGAALLITKYWEPIKAIFNKMWDGFIDDISYALGQLAAFLELMSNIPVVGDKFATAANFMKGISGDLKIKNEGADSPAVVTPQLAMSQSIQETRNQSFAEVRIKDDTGRAEMTQENNSGGLITMMKTAGAV